jgi:hypothetical protein
LSFSFVASFCKLHRFQVDAPYKLHNSQLGKQRGLVIKKSKSLKFHQSIWQPGLTQKCDHPASSQEGSSIRNEQCDLAQTHGWP